MRGIVDWNALSRPTTLYMHWDEMSIMVAIWGPTRSSLRCSHDPRSSHLNGVKQSHRQWSTHANEDWSRRVKIE